MASASPARRCGVQGGRLDEGNRIMTDTGTLLTKAVGPEHVLTEDRVPEDYGHCVKRSPSRDRISSGRLCQLCSELAVARRHKRLVRPEAHDDSIAVKDYSGEVVCGVAELCSGQRHRDRPRTRHDQAPRSSGTHRNRGTKCQACRFSRRNPRPVRPSPRRLRQRRCLFVPQETVVPISVRLCHSYGDPSELRDGRLAPT